MLDSEMPGNPAPDAEPVNDAGERLRSYVERIEKLEQEIRDIQGDRKDVYAEAKSDGFDTIILRRIIALRRKDPDTWRNEEDVLATYLHALGMV
jgi:uncharacterized protein (UPF0335 family)